MLLPYTNQPYNGFNKALVSINQGAPWEKFLLLQDYLSANELISN